MTPHKEPQVEVEWPEAAWLVRVKGLLNPEATLCLSQRAAKGWEETGAEVQRYLPATQPSLIQDLEGEIEQLCRPRSLPAVEEESMNTALRLQAILNKYKADNTEETN